MAEPADSKGQTAKAEGANNIIVQAKGDGIHIQLACRARGTAGIPDRAEDFPTPSPIITRLISGCAHLRG